MNLWRVYVELYKKLGEFDKVEAYCNKIDSINPTPFIRYSVLSARSLICCERKQYDKAWEMANEAIEFSDGSPVQKNEIMMLKLMIQSGMNDNGMLYKQFEQATALRDSIRDIEFNARLDELHTIYEVDKITTDKVRNRNYFLLTLGVCLLLAGLLGFYIYYNRQITLKNRGLYRKIKEQDRLMQELNAKNGADIPHTQPLPTGAKEQRQMVARLRAYLIKERYFTKYEIDIQALATEMTTNRTALFEAIKAVTGETPMGLINDLRLEEAKQLLDNSNLTIEAIAYECGFNNSRTFYRQFHEHYSITPAEYRREARRSGAFLDG